MGKNIIVLALIVCILHEAVCKYKLKQVTALSRHNVRTPTTIVDYDGKFTPRRWLQWNGTLGHLTKRGGRLEASMGEYFRSWLQEEQLITDCLNDNNIHVYANGIQRTKESAMKFTAAFKHCNITVNHGINEEMDSVFLLTIRNNSTDYIKSVIRNVQKKLDNLDLKASYKELEGILDFNKSFKCLNESNCDYFSDKNKYAYHEEKYCPMFVDGPLTIAHDMVDTFLMAFYEGMPNENVAWGKIKRGQWKSLLKLHENWLSLRFGQRIITRDISKPLLDYMTEIFLTEKYKFTLIMGHDANIYSVLSVLDIKRYNLPGQDEKVPVGGKVVFQKWHDEVEDVDLLKIEYVYQSAEQIRNGVEMSLKNPPRRVTLELEHCKIKESGYCLWSDFVHVLNSLI